MKKILLSILALLIVLAAAFSIYAYRQLTQFSVEKLTSSVDVIFGLGGNVGVLKTDDGVVVVDTKLMAFQGRKMAELIHTLSDKPVRYIINTHYHLDHTHGNPGFNPDVMIISTERTKELLLGIDGRYWEGENKKFLPTMTMTKSKEIKLGNKTVQLKYLGNGHTSGDVVVLFVEDRVIHMGDLLFYKRYPNIDLESGGSLSDWIVTLDEVLKLDFDKAIPGHGAVTDKEGIRQFQAFLIELRDAGRLAAKKGWSLEETIKNTKLTTDKDYHAITFFYVYKLGRDFSIKRSWEEATGAVVDKFDKKNH